MNNKRRQFLKNSAITAMTGMLLPTSIMAMTGNAKKIRVLVWDERSAAEKEAYDNFLGNCIADQLKKNSAFSVLSTGLNESEQGVSENILDETDVLIWWGHVKQAEITTEKGKSIVARIKAGKLSLIALHSAHWATPFVQAMNEITKMRILEDGSIKESDIKFVAPPKQYMLPKYDSRLTPYTIERKFPDGHKTAEVYLPICCFPSVRNDGKPSTVNVLSPSHPIMKGLPKNFQIPQTEMYDEPFHVPEPDQLLFEERWETGEWFRSGMIWNLGKGKVFYFRPGHETFPVFKEEKIMQILSNAAIWLAMSNK
jgi:trehalose utilization protein